MTRRRPAGAGGLSGPLAPSRPDKGHPAIGVPGLAVTIPIDRGKVNEPVPSRVPLSTVA